MIVLLRLAVQNLIQARRRTALLSLAVGLVTTFLVLLLSITHGIEDNLVRSATSLTTGHFNIFGWNKATSTEAAPIVQNAGALRKLVEENTPDLDYTLLRDRGWGKIVSDTSAIQSSLQGINMAEEGHFAADFQLAAEKDYKPGGSDEVKGDIQKLRGRHQAILFAGQAKRLGVDVGDTVTIQTETNGGRTNTLDVTVAAIGKDLGVLSSFVVILCRQDIQELYQTNPDTAGAILVYLHDIDQAEPTMNHLREVLADQKFQLMDYEPKPFFMKFESITGEDWTGQKLDLSLWRDEVIFLTYALSGINAITWALTAVLAMVISAGIMNAMWNAVRERTREIGMMRAVGMRQGRVLMMILMEAFLLGLFATSLGAVLGCLIALGVDAVHLPLPNQAMQAILLSNALHLAVPVASVLVAIGALTLLTTAASILPAWRASRLRPITAIQTVE